MKNKKQYSKLLALVLTVITCVGVFGGCKQKEEEVEIPVSLPEYDNSLELDLMGYVNPTDGSYTFDGAAMNSGTDYRTVERFQEYMDAGFNIAFARYDTQLKSDTTTETWPTCGTKIFCDKAYEAGIKKIVISDQFFSELISGGVAERYSTQEELDAATAARLSIYKDTPGFYGIALNDEPRYYLLDDYGLVFKSIKRVMPECFIYNNLHYCHKADTDTEIYVDTAAWEEEHGSYPTNKEAYTAYLRHFFEVTGAKQLAIDVYPFKETASEWVNSFYPNLQILKNICNEYGAEMSFTMQSISYISNGVYTNRIMTRNDLWLQMNALLGFGATSLQYYTYFPYPSYSDTNTSVGNFIDRQGNKTSVYYNGQAVNAAVRKFDEVILNYEFQGAKFYLNSTLKTSPASNYFGSGSTQFDNSYEHTLLKAITQDNDALLTTELKDEKNGLYMYMIMNAIDILHSSKGFMEYTDCTFTAEFPGYDYVAEFDCGELTYVKLDNGKYTKSLSSGYAVYLVPLKVA